MPETTDPKEQPSKSDQNANPQQSLFDCATTTIHSASAVMLSQQPPQRRRQPTTSAELLFAIFLNFAILFKALIIMNLTQSQYLYIKSSLSPPRHTYTPASRPGRDFPLSLCATTTSRLPHFAEIAQQNQHTHTHQLGSL